MDIGNGCIISNFHDYDITLIVDKPGRRSINAPSDKNSLHDFIEESLQGADLIVLTSIALRKKTIARRHHRQLQAPILNVTVSEQESALLLIEGKGDVYSWVYPNEATSNLTHRRNNEKHLQFTLGSTTPKRDLGPGRRSIYGQIASQFFEPVKAYVLKFVVEKSIDIAVHKLEGDSYVGPVILELKDSFDWKSRKAYRYSGQRPAKILLFIHGTFSSTKGSFGALLAPGTGFRFLSRVFSSYDLVLGFDHKTLMHTPQQNAEQLLHSFQNMRLPQDSTIDAIVFSRGGLVYRHLTEVLLPIARPDISLGKAIFVACTNGGTNLAKSEHWDSLLDLYTNIFLNGTRIISMICGTPMGPFAGESIKLLGRFAKLIPEIAINDNAVPGLAAMEPNSDLVQALNKNVPNMDKLAHYFAVTSNFQAHFSYDNSIIGFSKELLEFLLDRITDQLFKENNDLVVHTRSMVNFGNAQAKLAPDGHFAFGDQDNVYHTVYFAHPELLEKLTDWLDLKPGYDRLGDKINISVSKDSEPVSRRSKEESSTDTAYQYIGIFDSSFPEEWRDYSTPDETEADEDLSF